MLNNEIEKIIIKKTMIEIEIQNKFYIRFNGEIEKKNQFSKPKKIKKIRIKINMKNKKKILIE